MKWVAGGAIIAVFLFYLAVFVASAIYAPSTGNHPIEGRSTRILLGVLQWFAFFAG